MRSKNPANKLVRVKPLLREKIKWQRFNLMEADYTPVSGMFDLIVCRNVLMYFPFEKQEAVIRKLCGKLKQGGYFFLGHAESIMGMDVPLKQLKPSIFIKP